MTSFRKHLLIGIAALGLGMGSLAAYADNPGGNAPAGGYGMFGEHTRENFARHTAELHDKLKLSAAQEAAWKTYIAKVQPGERPARLDRAELDKLTAPERMERMLAHMKETEQRLTTHIAATKEFYAVLTPEQKKIFDDAFRHGPGHRRR